MEGIICPFAKMGFKLFKGLPTTFFIFAPEEQRDTLAAELAGKTCDLRGIVEVCTQ